MSNSDIIVTNPPFSLFKKYISLLIDNNKDFLIIGNKNALNNYKLFSYFKDGKVWLGHTLPLDFKLPNRTITTHLRGLCRWYTNLPVNRDNNITTLVRQYDNNYHIEYDNYHAINVDKIKDIPYDYNGLIGVPITIIDHVYSDGLAHFKKINDESQHSILTFKLIGTSVGNGFRNLPNVKKGLSKQFVKDYFDSGQTGDLREDLPVLGLYDKNNIPKVPFMRVIIQKI